MSAKKTTKSKSQPFIQEVGNRGTSLGPMFYIKVRTEDYRQLTWTEVWECFAAAYPGKWAVQFFPPADRLVDEVNMYHLFILDDAPSGVDINRR